MSHNIAIPSRIVYPNEFDVSEIVSAEHSLRTAIARIHRTGQMKAIFLGWPNLERICKKLAGMLTHGYPSNSASGNDLLSDMIDKAVIAYELASKKATKEQDLGDAFIKAIIEESVYLTDYEVHGLYANESSELWEPLSVPLCDWARQHKMDRLVFSPRVLSTGNKEREAARLVLAGKLLSVADAERIAGNWPTLH